MRIHILNCMVAYGVLVDVSAKSSFDQARNECYSVK